MKNKQILQYIKTICITICFHNAVYTMNIVRPFKFFFNPAPHYGTRWQLFMQPEYGFRAKGFNSSSHQVNAAQILYKKESSLAMLNGFQSDSNIGKKRIQVDAEDDGVRGRLTARANLNVDFGCTLAVRRTLPHNILFGIYIPFYTIRLKNIFWCDHTKNESSQDVRVHEYLTDNIGQNVCDLGNLDIGPWRRTGLGDISIVADWLQDFIQSQPVLRNVRLNGRLGLTLPTGKKENINKILAFPFGYNGTVAMIFGGGLNLSLGSYTHAGFDVEVRALFGNTTCQRIKIDTCQTELLLLQKARVYNDYALEQQYTLYTELYDLIPHTSCRLAYQFFKRGDSAISIYGNCFSETIANNAEQLQERNWHEILATLTYDFGHIAKEQTHTIPSLSLFAEIPFKGKRVIVCPGLGISMNIDF